MIYSLRAACSYRKDKEGHLGRQPVTLLTAGAFVEKGMEENGARSFCL